MQAFQYATSKSRCEKKQYKNGKLDVSMDHHYQKLPNIFSFGVIICRLSTLPQMTGILFQVCKA